jgi:hypothetical protein
VDPDTILAELHQVATAQLHAARTLDLDALHAATEQRATLIESLTIGPPPSADAVAAHGAAIQQLDDRLGRLLTAGKRAMRCLNTSLPIYNRSGRLRGGTR